jgi:hypothetical protein
MISADFAHSFAQYNKWQNSVVIEAADQLSEHQRQKNMGAFFGNNNIPPPIIRIKMSPVLSLDSYFLSVSEASVGGGGKRNFFDFSRRIAD